MFLPHIKWELYIERTCQQDCTICFKPPLPGEESGNTPRHWHSGGTLCILSTMHAFLLKNATYNCAQLQWLSRSTVEVCLTIIKQGIFCWLKCHLWRNASESNMISHAHCTKKMAASILAIKLHLPFKMGSSEVFISLAIFVVNTRVKSWG